MRRHPFTQHRRPMTPLERRLYDAITGYLARPAARVQLIHRVDTIEQTRWQDDGGPTP